jgi:hypothetical protein
MRSTCRAPDVAFGGFAALLQQYGYLSEEMKLADSLTLDGSSLVQLHLLQALYGARRLTGRHQSRVMGNSA